MTATQRRARRVPYLTLLLHFSLDTRQQQAALKRLLKRPLEQSGRKGFPSLPAAVWSPDSGAAVIPEGRRPSIGWCPPAGASSHTAAPRAIASPLLALLPLPRVSEGMIESNNRAGTSLRPPPLSLSFFSLPLSLTQPTHSR